MNQVFRYVCFVITICSNLLHAVIRNQMITLPSRWSQMCHLTPTGNTSHITISCHVTDDDLWDLKDLRSWSATLHNDTKITVDINCDVDGRVCLPWPYRAHYLDTLKVRECVNVCYMKDFAQPEALNTIPDTLRVFEGYDMKVQASISDLININIKNVSASLGCGPLLVQTFIYEGTRYTFLNSVVMMNMTDDEVTDSFVQSVQDTAEMEHECRYNNMRVYDVSRRVDASSNTLYTTLVNSYFPVLHTLNLSSTELQAYPALLEMWRRRFPELTTLDLSHNHIARFEISADLSLSTASTWSVNLTHNSIETLGPHEMKSFKLKRGLIDIRHNPLRCDCSMRDFSEFLRTHGTPEAADINLGYSYLWTLTCASPYTHRGSKISDLSGSVLCDKDTRGYQSVVYTLSAAVVVLIILVLIGVFLQICKKRKSKDNTVEMKGESCKKSESKLVPLVTVSEKSEHV